MDYVSAVERLFAEAPDRFEELRRNLVTDRCFHGRLDSIREQKRAACRVLRALDWFAQTGPRDAQPLPLSYDEREDLKRGGLPLQYIVAWFARSLAYRDYAFEGHPSLERYACGVLASPHAPDFIKNDASLAKDHPPCLLDGLGPGLVWTPGAAGIRNATPQRRREFLQAPPPPATNSGQDLIKRAAANVPDWYAPAAHHFLQLNNDAFIAHATNCAPCKRLPKGWRVHEPGEGFRRWLGHHNLWVRASDYGWVIERHHLLNSRDKELLTYCFVDAPVLCPTHVIAARLAEASYPNPAHRYLLYWNSRQ